MATASLPGLGPDMSKVNFGFIAAIVAVATIGGFMFGYDSGVINGTQKGLEAAFDLGKLGIGINVGAILVGSSIGAFTAGRLADRIGRLVPVLAIGIPLVIIGSAVSAALFDDWKVFPALIERS